MKTTLLCLLVPVAVLCAGCAASSAVSKPTGGAGGCAVEIPLTSQGGGAAWAERVATEAKDEALLVAKWENPANEPWGGFGNPTVKDWQGTVDLSASKGCTLTFKAKGTGIEQVRIKLKGYDDPTDISKNESQTLLLAKYYDPASGLVKIPLKAFDRAEFPWQETRQVIFDTWQRKGDVHIEISFPVQIAENQ